MLKLIILSFSLFAVNALAVELNDVKYSWVQIIDHNKISVRSVSHGTSCPLLEIGGKSVQMTTRATPDSRFNNTVCEYIAPITTTEIFLNNRYKMPSFDPMIGSIAVIGDTGCRKSVLTNQNCKTGWPFAKITSLIAKQNPNLVIHVGDYLYREGLCAGNICPGSPGDKDFIWEADALEPMNEIFKQSVLAFVRGNHESCQRNYRGWNRYFDNKGYTEICSHDPNFWHIDILDKRIYFLDSSAEDGFIFNKSSLSVSSIKDTISAIHNKQQNGISKKLLFTHVPLLWTSSNITYVTPFGDYLRKHGLLQEFSAAFSGHLHIGQFTKIKYSSDKVFSQIITGNSGAMLESPEKSSLYKRTLKTINNEDTLLTNYIEGYGFGMISLANNDVTFMSKHGTEISTYKFD